MDIFRRQAGQDEDGGGGPDARIAEWLTELDYARKREKNFRQEGRRLIELYESEKGSEYQFNILFSNTETLAPALYNVVPRPVVAQRHKANPDPLGALASKLAQRTLEFLLDSSDQEYSDFDDAMKTAVLEALVPGRGVTRFKYEAKFEEVEPPADGVEGEEGAAAEASERVSYETVCVESIPWDRFLHGYAKKWTDVPWIAFEHFFTAKELSDNFGEIGARVPLSIQGGEDGAADDEEKSRKLANSEGVKLAHVYEIWDKATRKVLFLAPAYKGQFLRETDDPLGLSGFYPLPQPLSFYAKISSLVPTPLYAAYEEQAKELNRITVRINKIIGALKVRGFYDSTLDGLDKLLQSEDNALLPAENVAAMQQGQTLEKAIWLMPLEKLISVLQQLYLQRQQIKTVIYEVTGISDILRGASAASETATAQNIKNQWGTLRLKRLQKIMQRYARDSLRIMTEIAVTKLSPATLMAMSGMSLPSQEQKQQVQSILAQQKQQAMMMAAQGNPAKPPEPPPELLETLQTPSIEEVLELLRGDLQRNYRIDVETNSTVDAEAVEDKKNMGEFLNAIAQFMNGVAPMVENGSMPFEVAKTILLNVTRRYQFGSEVEDELRKMQPPKQQGKPGEGEAAEKAKIELETMKQESQLRMQELQMELKVKEQELQLKIVEMQRKAEFQSAQHQMKMQSMMAKAALAAQSPSPGQTEPSNAAV